MSTTTKSRFQVVDRKARKRGDIQPPSLSRDEADMLRDALDSAQLNAKAVSVEDSPQPTRRLAHARIGIPYRAALYAFGLVPEGLKVRCEPIERDGAWIATLRFTIVKRERS